MPVQIVELNALIPWIVNHHLAYKLTQIVVESFQKLNGLDLPHFFNLDVVERFIDGGGCDFIL
mgnify:CR=1 FL=1